MNVPSRYKEIWAEALEAKNEARSREAAFLFEQAREIASRHGLAERAFAAGSWAAAEWDLAGNPLVALRLATELLSDVPRMIDPIEVFAVRMRAFLIFFKYNPALANLELRLDELELMLSENATLPQATLDYLRVQLLEARGELESALDKAELGWTHKAGKRGFFRYIHAEEPFRLNLKLGRRSETGRWCAVLGETDSHLPESRAAWHAARGDLALWDQQSRIAEACSRDLEDVAAGLQSPRREHEALRMRIRALLLCPEYGDPLGSHHPIRGLLTTRPSGKLALGVTFSRRLLCADIRLAALRHTAGVPPVDDRWFTKPQEVPRRITIAYKSDFQRRVTQVRRACRSAMILAEDLDRRFECDWRQRKVRDRLDRLEEILRAARL